MAFKETGIQLLARLGSRPSIEGIQPALFDQGPNMKDVIEIFGAEATGKTELLYHILVTCILPKKWEDCDLSGHEAGVIFIDTDYKFSVLRVTTLLEKHIAKTLPDSTLSTDSVAMETFIRTCLRRLQVVRCSSSSELVVTLHNLETVVCCDTRLSVIMIDSISAFYWPDKFSGGESTQAQEANMKLIAAILGKLVNMYNLTLFVTKAMVYKKKGSDGGPGRSAGDNGDRGSRDLEEEHAEFLCRSWQRLVSHRLVCVTVPRASPGSAGFMVGGDVAQGNRSFTVTDWGVRFEER